VNTTLQELGPIGQPSQEEAGECNESKHYLTEEKNDENDNGQKYKNYSHATRACAPPGSQDAAAFLKKK
jgi:hypothetical protein